MRRLLSLAALILASACSSTTDAEFVSGNPSLLQRGTWYLTGISLAGGGVSATRVLLTASFGTQGRAGIIAGKAGPNSYGGTYGAQNNSISIGSLEMTMIGEEGPVRASDYLALMQRAVDFSVSDTRLRLRLQDGRILHFAHQP